MSRMQFLNTYVDNITMREALEKISFLAQHEKGNYVVTPNVDHIVKIEKDEEFRQIYKNASLILTDGKPLIWISKLLKTPIKEKISGSDLFPLVCKMAAEKGYTMFFLGAAKGVADTAAKNLTTKYPNLKVVGTYSPDIGFEKNHSEVEKIVNIVNKYQPDILVLALGTPKQEKFFYSRRKDFDVHVALAVGASIDFEAGIIKRAPKWMSEHGLEWLYRLCKEPKRLFKRYLVDDLKIIYIAGKYRRLK